MSDKKGKRGPRLLAVREFIRRLPVWVRIVATLVSVELAGMVVAFGLKQAEIGILAFHAVILTVLVGITYKYARSTDEMARATVDLARATREELLLSESERESEEITFLRQLLIELRKAEIRRRPPFDLSTWELKSGRVLTIKRIASGDREIIEVCYGHLIEENESLARWKDLEDRLGGPRLSQELALTRKQIHSMEECNLQQIRPAIGVLEHCLKQYE